MQGRAEQFMEDLQYYQKYRKECDGLDLAIEDVNFEDFLAFLDIEFHLGLRGSDTWSRDGNEAKIVVKTLIGEILAECMPEKVPDLYLEFAKKLQPDDFVLTFNYDCLLEQALEEIGKPYRLFPNRYKEIRGTSATIDDERDEVVILKLHGSIDWFDRSSFDQSAEAFRAQGVPGHPKHPIFHPEVGVRTMPLADGPRFHDDPLSKLERIGDRKGLYQRALLFRATPFVIPPSTSKILWFDTLKDFWWGMNSGGSLSFRMAIIGFSMSPHDDYARQVIYTLVRNYQRYEWGKEYSGKIKTALLLVDLRQTSDQQDAFRQRFRFVDWDRARAHFDGFDETVVAQF